jgi:hypothetical protein
MLWIVVALAIVHWLNSRAWFSEWWRPGHSFRRGIRLRRRRCSLIDSAALHAVYLFSFLTF